MNVNRDISDIHGPYAKNLRGSPQYAILFVKYNKTGRPGATDKAAKTDEGEGAWSGCTFLIYWVVVKTNLTT